jgi:Protein of unknown function (DUF1778)
MRSVRLDPELEALVRRAAAQEGATVSEFLRRAVAERAERTLAQRPSEQLEDVVGAVRSAGGQAGRTGEAFGDLLADRRREA